MTGQSTRCKRHGAGGISLFLVTIFSLIVATPADSQTPGTVGYEQKRGDATVRLEGRINEAGQVQVRLSDAIQLTFSVSGSPTLEVAPLTEPTPSKDWEVLRKETPQRLLEGDQARWQQVFVLTPLKPGQLTLPLTALRYRDTTRVGAWKEVIWQVIPVNVVTEITQVDLSELRGITGTEGPPSLGQRFGYGWIGVVCGIVFLLGLAGIWGLRHVRRNEPTLRADQWALRDLGQLPIPGAGSDFEVERFHTAISAIIRKYLMQRFQLPALEQTTVEFFEALRHSPLLKDDQQDTLREFLERCDLVKFARVRPAIQQCADTVAMAQHFVEQTAYRDQEASSN